MTAEVVLAAFLLVDLLGVLAGLAYLHRRRCIADITDMRYRGHPERPRQTLGR
jgi:hypothetical protein